jgi:hypothetical protein
MVQVGVFTVGQPKHKCVEKRILNSIKYILSENEFNSIVYDEDSNGLDVIYVFSDDWVINKMEKMFTFNKVLKEYKDVTKEILFQKDLPKVFSENNNKKILMEFLDKNLNSDLVLDKINYMGINSLTEIDYIKIKKPTF